MKNIFSMLVALTICLSAHADVPHIFTAGEAALASEVNENFAYLDTKIDGACTSSDNLYGDSITYTVNNLASGTVLNLVTGGLSLQYKMLTIPVFDPLTNKRYAVKLPYKESVNISIINSNNSCSGNITISGFPVTVKTLEMQTISRNVDGSFIFGKYVSGAQFDIKIGDAVVRISTPFETQSSVNGNDNGTPFDLTDDITSGVQSTRLTAAFAELDAYIDYIVITEI